MIASSCDERVWSNKSTANCWHFRRSSKYSALDSCSANARLRNSHESYMMNGKKKLKRTNSEQHTWNAVWSGSMELKAINDGLAKALYSLTLDNECRNESSVVFRIQSSHGHFTSLKWLIFIWGFKEKRLSDLRVAVAMLHLDQEEVLWFRNCFCGRLIDDEILDFLNSILWFRNFIFDINFQNFRKISKKKFNYTHEWV